MSTTTKNVGRVSIVPKGDWNINNTYIRLDLVTYDGNSYIAKKDVPKNIQLSNNNYWMLIASKGAQGAQGEQGEQGAPFAIMKSYASIAAMNADFSNTDVQNGQFVIIDTGNVQDPDNAKLYYKGSNNYVFVTDMSGTAGIQGPRGASAYEQAVAGGYEGTEAQFNEDLADFKELSEQAASSATAADNSAKDAEAYAIGKRGDTNVESTDPTYHNNAKYYSEQAALIVDDVEQVMTSTTIGPTAFATFDASVASMPLKGLTADIEPVQNFNGYSRPWLGGAGKNQLSLSMSFLCEKNTNGTWINNSYVSNGVTFIVQLNNDNDVIGIKVNGTASANTDFVFIERAPISEYPIIENGCPSGGSDSTYRITTRVYYSDFSVIDYYDYGSGLRLSNMDGHSESFSSSIRIFSGYTASNLIFRPMIRFQFDEDETFEPYSNICPITGWTGCKLHHTGVSLIGGDTFLGNAFTKTDSGYELTYNGSSVANRGSAYADISGIPAGRYVLQFLNCSYPDGIEVAFRRRTNGTLTSIGTIIGSSTSGARAFDIPANTTELQFYIVPNSTVAIGTKVTMDDAILYRNGETAEPYKGNTYDVTFPSPNPGTVYGGTLDAVNKQLIVTKKYALLNDPDKWSKTGINSFQYSDQFSDRKRYRTFLEGFLCSCANTSFDSVLQARWSGVDTDYFYFSQFSPSNDNILDKIKTAAANNKIAILYDLAEPLVYDITTEQVATLLGENNIWANIGDVTVTYGAYLETIKIYADQAVDSAAAEAAQEAAEAVLESIPADYTELSEDVDNLKSDFNMFETRNVLQTQLVRDSYIKGSGNDAGTPVSRGKFVRTKALIAGFGEKISIELTNPTYEYYVSYYGDNGALDGTDYLGYSGYNSTIFVIPEQAKLIGITFRRVDQGELTSDALTEISNSLYFYGVTDISLSESGKSADAKATGTAIENAGIYWSHDVNYLIPTYDGLIAKYDELCSMYPQYITKNTLTSGDFTNYEYVLTIGNYNSQNGQRGQDAEIAKPTILISSGVHGYERSSVMGLYGVVKAMCENVESLNKIIYAANYRIIPIACPWGYTNDSRVNNNGVNINRNFDTTDWTLLPEGPQYSGTEPANQPETKVMQTWLETHNDALIYIDWHNSGYLNEISCLLGLNTTETTKWKKKYLTSLNNVIPWWMKGRNIPPTNIYAYTGAPTVEYSNPGTAVTYAREHNIETAFVLETSWNVIGTGKHSKFSLGVGQEAFANMMIGFADLINGSNAAILG